jgi:hypothetical protein
MVGHLCELFQVMAGYVWLYLVRSFEVVLILFKVRTSYVSFVRLDQVMSCYFRFAHVMIC